MKHLVHIHSQEEGKIPDPEILEVGELAVNNNKSEIFIKNTEEAITNFSRIGETKEKVENKVTSINSLSTHTQYPSAKCFYSWMLEIFNNSNGGVNNYTTVGYYVDLSRCDINLKPQPLRETANSYIISQPGFYCFPLVYGCGIKEKNVPGDTDLNPESYTPFNISSPYISGISSASIIESDEINPTIENLTLLEGGYLGFHVSSIPSSGANYKLGVLDSSNEVLWSWHIWLWSEPLNLERVYNAYDNEYDILPVNLGSKYVNGELKSWFFQWGRKDPITFDNPSVVSGTGDDCTKFYTSWEPRINYWDFNKTSATSGENLIGKTIYDPCPRGFVVPNAKVFSGFTTIGEWIKGWYVKRYSTDTEGIFFPALSYLNSSGVLVNDEGKYWTSGLLNENNAYVLSLTENNLSNNSTIQFNYGLSIRPVLQK